MIVGMILAAGKGSRLNSVDRNKTSLAVAGKPLVAYGAELFSKTVDKTLVVVGAFGETVQDALRDFDVTYAWQREQKGTGHAVRVGVDAIEENAWNPSTVCVGYGDHMMFYSPEVIQNLLAQHSAEQAAITLVTTSYATPNDLAWGRIQRDAQNKVVGIVEQKDATAEQLEIQELNAGFYSFDYSFLREALSQLKPSPVTGEYYLTDVIEIAQKQGKVVSTLTVPFSLVGTGINTKEQLEQTDAILTA